MSKKSCPILYSNLNCEMGQELFDIQYSRYLACMCINNHKKVVQTVCQDPNLDFFGSDSRGKNESGSIGVILVMIVKI